MWFEGLTKKPPSLVDLCVRIAIDNVKYIGYVGGVDFQLLEQILQHCTLEQLKHIEDSTQVRSFSHHMAARFMFLPVSLSQVMCIRRFCFVRTQILVQSPISFGRDSMRSILVKRMLWRR